MQESEQSADVISTRRPLQAPGRPRVDGLAGSGGDNTGSPHRDQPRSEPARHDHTHEIRVSGVGVLGAPNGDLVRCVGGNDAA